MWLSNPTAICPRILARVRFPLTVSGIPCLQVRPLMTKDSWKRQNALSHHIQAEQDRTIIGRQLGPEFVSESHLKLSGLISLPGEMDATQSFNFIKMAPASYSQSGILQPLQAEIGDSNARSVNLHRKI